MKENGHNIGLNIKHEVDVAITIIIQKLGLFGSRQADHDDAMKMM